MIWSTLYPTDGLSHVTEVVLTAVSVSPAAEQRKITSKMCFFEDLLHWNGDTKENMEMSNDLHNITGKSGDVPTHNEEFHEESAE